jgi:hypothetical protein
MSERSSKPALRNQEVTARAALLKPYDHLVSSTMYAG